MDLMKNAAVFLAISIVTSFGHEVIRKEDSNLKQHDRVMKSPNYPTERRKYRALCEPVAINLQTGENGTNLSGISKRNNGLGENLPEGKRSNSKPQKRKDIVAEDETATTIHEETNQSDKIPYEGQVLGHDVHEDMHKTIIVIRKIAMPYAVEKMVHYPIVKNIPFPVKVPVPQPYPVEKQVPYPVKVYIKVPVKIPKPVPVVKEVPYPIHVHVDRPVPVKVYVPKPYPVEKEVRYEVKVPIPEPYPIERKIPVPVKVPVQMPQPYPVGKVVPYPIKFEVEQPVQMPQPYPVGKVVPYPIKFEVEQPVSMPISKSTHYPVREQVSVPINAGLSTLLPVDKSIPMKVKIPIPESYQITKNLPDAFGKPKSVQMVNHVLHPFETSMLFPIKLPLMVPKEEEDKEGEID